MGKRPGRGWIFFGIIIACGLLQATLLDALRVFNLKPDLLLLCCVFASLSFEPRIALILSAFCGIFKDILSGPGLANTVLFCIWSLLIIKLSRNVALESRRARLLLVFCVGLTQNIACGLISVYSGRYIAPGIFLRIVFAGSLYTALILALMFRFVNKEYLQSEV
jgi:rod shape-determining protein MreD